MYALQSGFFFCDRVNVQYCFRYFTQSKYLGPDEVASVADCHWWSEPPPPSHQHDEIMSVSLKD